MAQSPPPLAARISYNPPRHPSPLTHSAVYPTRHRPAVPMSIPRSDRVLTSVPPPLPPPTNTHELALTGTNPSWFDSTWGGFTRSPARPEITLSRRSRTNSRDHLDSSLDMDPARKLSTSHLVASPQEKDDHMVTDDSRTPSDEEQTSTSPTRLHSERQLERSSLSTSSQAYDRNLLSKIGGPNTSSVRLPSLSSSVGDSVPLSPGNTEARAPAISRLSVPERRRSSNDSSFSSRHNSVTSSILHSTLHSTPSFRSHSIFEAPEHGRSRPKLNIDECPPQSNIPAHMEDHAFERGQMRDLNINDRSSIVSDNSASARAGMKRRASSPQRALSRSERSSVGTLGNGIATDLYHRRSLQQFPPRSDPSARQAYAHYSSVSSASSFGPRTGSYASTMGYSAASSVTSVGSGHLSPSLLSPNLDPELSVSKSLNPSPRNSLAIHSLPRQALENTAHQAAHIAEHSAAAQHTQRIHGLLICECCPKKPKKFGNEEDLRLHHMEKQYTCQYCPNRFKNKNEAERHQNSLHLRRHSWSCAALQSIEHAFHPSHMNGGVTDVCGYCGEEFSNPADWATRRHHVSTVHKFGECNQVKKFFRADHFRQHLKHSHGGTSGKWTNVLETVCMRDEPLPQPINRSASNAGIGYYSHAPTSGAIQMTGNAPAIKPDTISEVPQER